MRELPFESNSQELRTKSEQRLGFWANLPHDLRPVLTIETINAIYYRHAKTLKVIDIAALPFA